jgi:hypothetical protein
MNEKLAIAGGTPVLRRSDYANWPIITADDRRFINEVLDSVILPGGTAPQVSALEREWAGYTGWMDKILTAFHKVFANLDQGLSHVDDPIYPGADGKLYGAA